jgi:hypothetical protein
MIASEASLRFAVRNVAKWGDTDVLPFPLENHWFHDAEDDVVALLTELDFDFAKWLSDYPILFDRVLAAVGYVGFRGATQIDPIWNAYLLALVAELGPEIEAARIPTSANRVFSYRFALDSETHTMFNRKIGWGSFQSHALREVENYRYVLSTDISDFYPRVYHHRIKNALGQATANKEAARRTETLLSKLSVGGVSYGLPVGGNAARLLAELLLNRTDRLLLSRGIAFCRFVDDYYLFANSEEDARAGLVYLSEILLAHEGLSLQRAKTRLMTRSEFARTSPVAESETAESEGEAHTQEFLKLRLMYDPYSPTANDDYERLRTELEKFDVVGMLARELRKSRIDEVLVRQLVKSLRYLAPELRDAAVGSLMQNLEVLYPLFPSVALVVKALLQDLSEPVKQQVFSRLRTLVQAGSHIFLVPANLCFALRVLVQDPSEETDTLLAQLYESRSTQPIVRRDLILCLARRRVDYRVADVLRRFSALTPWEKRALIPASYLLGDEGFHWRQGIKAELHPVDQRFMAWIGLKNSGRLWEIPL